MGPHLLPAGLPERQRYNERMQDDESRGRVRQEPADQVSGPEMSAQSASPTHSSGIPVHRIPQAPKRTEIQQIADRVKRAEWWMIWLTAAIAFSGFCAVGVGFMQWHEIHSGSTDTHTLAEAAKSQADRMTDVSAAADKIREAAQNMVTQDQRIADNAKKALDASNKQSRTALDAAIAQNRLDQRPWIGIGQFRVARFEETKPVTIEVHIVNSGKTPALNVTEWMKYKYGTISQLGPLPSDSVSAAWQHVGSIPPQGNQVIDIYLPWDIWKQNSVGLTTKRAGLSFFGEIAYDDVAGSNHRTQVCIFMNDVETRDLAFCEGWGDMN